MPDPVPAGRRGGWLEVFAVFLRLGLTSFGGPVAHIGYFRQAFVVRRRWLSDAAFAELVTLCQFLPGPASSQVGFCIGLARAGPAGAAAAWLGFTLPSASLLTACALGFGALQGPMVVGLAHGLAVVATAVVAQALVAMTRTLAPDGRRAAIAVAALAVVTAVAGAGGQVLAIGVGALIGVAACRQSDGVGADALDIAISRGAGLTALTVFGLLLAGSPIAEAAGGGGTLAVFDAFFRSGALVFGGGHVVLPLLEHAVVVPGWVSRANFLAGYGAAQAVPGPLFAFAAYLGAAIRTPGGPVAGAAFATAAIFLPGLLIVVAVLPFWRWVRASALARAGMRGAGASVVGILAAALYDPIWRTAVLDRADFAVVAAAFSLLAMFRTSPVAVVALGGAYGVTKAFLTV